ncbi:MAG: helix-turn-helix domain-containing protein [Anaerovoracaceae bacterium]|jgi:transcriptional regulator with XRE-family HTH domain
MEIGKIIAHNLKKLREERNLSQSQLAKMADISKVVVSQIEKGDSNPTINTIWKLTGALGLPYTSLLEMESTRTVHVKREDVSDLAEDEYHIFNYYSKNEDRNFEVYRVEMEGGCDHTSIGHSSGSNEYILVTEGEITIVVDECEYKLRKEDALFFDASVSHRYINNKKSTAKMTLIIQYV